MSALLDLARFDQSYWLDDLSRPMIESGELDRRITEEGLTGVTVNPAIFRAALHASDAYDRQIEALAGQPSNSIYEALLVTDVRDACDVLRSVYERTDGRDGFVSLEISPHLARSTSASIDEARRFWEAVARPNLLIKIPGTSEGVSVVEALLFEGINVNITLLFAVERYEEVALAYMRALERRKAANAPLAGIASVASFFLSRIDRRRRATAAEGRKRPAASRAPARQVCGRKCPARVSSLSAARFLRTMEIARGGGRAQTAPTVGQHQHEESVLPRVDVRGALDRPAHDHHAAA